MEAILKVTRHLAAPFELLVLLAEVTAAARRVLRGERASVWLFDAATEELVLEVASDIRHVRIPVSRALVGAAARAGRVVNTPDWDADERFDRSVGVQSGFRGTATRPHDRGADPTRAGLGERLAAAAGHRRLIRPRSKGQQARAGEGRTSSTAPATGHACQTCLSDAAAGLTQTDGQFHFRFAGGLARHRVVDLVQRGGQAQALLKNKSVGLDARLVPVESQVGVESRHADVDEWFAELAVGVGAEKTGFVPDAVGQFNHVHMMAVPTLTWAGHG